MSVRVVFSLARFSVADAANLPPNRAGAARRGDPPDDREGAALPADGSDVEAIRAVNGRDREGLIARIRQIRRASAETAEPASTSAPGQDDLRALETRIAHLEQLVQGLQDSVHRESTRLEKRIAELEARLEPASLGRALSEDARERGL